MHACIGQIASRHAPPGFLVVRGDQNAVLRKVEVDFKDALAQLIIADERLAGVGIRCAVDAAACMRDIRRRTVCPAVIIAGGIGEGLLIKKGQIIRKVPEEQLLAVLREELEHWQD